MGGDQERHQSRDASKPSSRQRCSMFASRQISRWWILPIALLLLGALACGGSAEESLWGGSDEAEFTSAPAQPAAMAMADAPMRKELIESQAAAAPGLPGRPGPPGAPAAAAAAVKLAAVAESVESAASSDQQVAQLVTQQRIIIRTVDMGVEVDGRGCCHRRYRGAGEEDGRLGRLVEQAADAHGLRLDSRPPGGHAGPGGAGDKGALAEGAVRELRQPGT